MHQRRKGRDKGRRVLASKIFAQQAPLAEVNPATAAVAIMRL
jgi:hypothetical protein